MGTLLGFTNEEIKSIDKKEWAKFCQQIKDSKPSLVVQVDDNTCNGKDSSQDASPKNEWEYDSLTGLGSVSTLSEVQKSIRSNYITVTKWFQELIS